MPYRRVRTGFLPGWKWMREASPYGHDKHAEMAIGQLRQVLEVTQRPVAARRVGVMV